jgi:hypothetical protein
MHILFGLFATKVRKFYTVQRLGQIKWLYKVFLNVYFKKTTYKLYDCPPKYWVYYLFIHNVDLFINRRNIISKNKLLGAPSFFFFKLKNIQLKNKLLGGKK